MDNVQTLEPRKYCRPVDIIEWSGRSKSFVMRAIWAGELEAYKKGRAWLVPIDAYRRWIEGDEAAA